MDGDLTLGGLFAFQTLTASFSTPVTALLQQNAELQSLRADVERIQDIYKYKPAKQFAEVSDGSDKMCDQLDFEMRNITFGYSKFEEPLVRDFSLKIEPGKRVALVGHSGSGKSTIAKLANGTLIPWSGEILLNGKPLNSYTKEEYYSLIGTVDQNIMLFSGTVGENLTLFAPLYDASVLQKAVRDAAIEEELTARGDMLQQTVDENGRNFSGGQCQRLEIARTLAQQTPMLILDEATSALDPVTELQIDSAIRKRKVSCLIVAHRLSTVRDCDEIIMLENGVVLERGTHQELMQLNGAYAQMMNLEQGGAS
jgi:ABC-type bacteriocin/lantibiotic exporter with double-glycine peptidase domain